MASSTLAAVSTTTPAAIATSTPIIHAASPISAPLPAPATAPDRTNSEDQVRAYFSDIPVMIEIARYESKFREFADSGNVFRGGTNNSMIGIFQIDERLHRQIALGMGMDIDTIAGNLAYARHLYSISGTAPWISSMPCWDAHPAAEGNGLSVVQTLTNNLYFGISAPQVQTLQRILNRIGYVIASSGSGSPGNETTMFGGLTRAAVRRFQCDSGIVCSGDEYTTKGIQNKKNRRVCCC